MGKDDPVTDKGIVIRPIGQSGIEASADPILAARSAAYSESFNRRSRESLSTGAKP